MPAVRSSARQDITAPMGTTFVFFDLQKPDPQSRIKSDRAERNTVREELRAEWNAELSECSH